MPPRPAAAFGAISSVVERHIDIVKAGGPIPPSRTVQEKNESMW
jgi:hypothetical protein